MASLKHKRAPIRAAFTRTLNELKTEILKEEHDSLTINRLKKHLDDRFACLEKVDEEISCYLQGKETTEEEFAEEYNSVIEYRDRFSDASFSIDCLCNKSVHDQFQHEIFDDRSGNTVTTRSRYKLPKLELQKFNGDPIEWLGWWSQFKGIDGDVTLSAEHKFQYLIQVMIPKSVAYDLVVSFPPTAENYPKAIRQLKSRFGNDKILIEVYIRELLKLVLNNSMSQNKSITPIYDKLETQLRALESLGVTKEKYAAMLYPLVESALPVEVLQVWQRIRNQTCDQENADELTSIMKFLRNEVDSEIRMKLANTSIRAGTDSEKSVQHHSTAMFNSKSADKDDVCYFCKKPGHIKPYCKQFRKWTEKQNQKDKSEPKSQGETSSANAAQAESSSDEEDHSQNYSLSIGNLKANQWILDSGGRRHVCHKKKHFQQLDESYRGKIKVANGEYVPVMGIGTVKLKLMTQQNKVQTVTVNNVLYVPKLIGNVLSVSTLTRSDYKVEFDRLIGKLKFKKSDVVVADVTSDGMYVMRQSKEGKK